MEFVLHLGAHKTASTYLQQLLSENAAILSDNGVGFVAPPEYRQRIMAARSKSRLLNRVSTIRQRRRGKVIADFVQHAEDNGHRRFVLSEENLLGTLDKVLLGTWFYDQAGDQLHSALRCLGQRSVTILLAVRSYANFFASAYAQALKAGRFVPFDSGLRARCLALERGWPEVIADLSSALPTGSEIVVWQYEDFATNERHVLQHFVGHRAARNLTPLKIRPMKGPSQQGIEILHEINAEQGPPDLARIRQVMRYHAKTKGRKAFDPWSPSERVMLDQRYANDLAEIAANWPTALAHPVLSDGLSLSLNPASAYTPTPGLFEDNADYVDRSRSCDEVS